MIEEAEYFLLYLVAENEKTPPGRGRLSPSELNDNVCQFTGRANWPTAQRQAARGRCKRSAPAWSTGAPGSRRTSKCP